MYKKNGAQRMCNGILLRLLVRLAVPFRAGASVLIRCCMHPMVIGTSDLTRIPSSEIYT